MSRQIYKKYNKNNLNPVFVPYDLPIEDIKCFYIPPYKLTVDKDKVPEINLETPDKYNLFYIDFNIV